MNAPTPDTRVEKVDVTTRSKWRKAFALLGMFLLMSVCGVLALVLVITFFMNLGLKYHDNYEYYGLIYGGSPVLVSLWVLGIAGFLSPAVLVWYLKKHAWRVSLRTVLMAMLTLSVILGIYSLSL